MAGALRKVSQDYNWTIKRADNDVRHNISYIASPLPQTPQASPSLEPITVDFSLSPWDVSVRFSIFDSEGHI